MKNKANGPADCLVTEVLQCLPKGLCTRSRIESRSCSKVNAELQRHGRRLWNKAQAMFRGTVRDLANLER